MSSDSRSLSNGTSVAPIRQRGRWLGTSGVWVGLGDSAVGLRQDSYLLDESSAQFRPLLGTPPSPRAESASAYDAEREEVVVFGGGDERGLFGDTLTFSVETGYQAHL